MPSLDLLDYGLNDQGEIEDTNSITSNASNVSSVYSQVSAKPLDQISEISSQTEELGIVNKSDCINSNTVQFLEQADKIWKSCSDIVDTRKRVSSCKFSNIKTFSKPAVKTQLSEGGRSERSECELKVSKIGNKRMRDIKCPTVFVNVRSKCLMSSSVYYLLLEPTSGRFEGQIAALMFTDTSSGTQTAELLPLVVRITRTHSERMILKPMLLYKCYNELFREGCRFNFKTLKFAKQHLPVQSRMLKKLIIHNIEMMPKDTLRILRPLQLSKGRDHVKSVKSRQQAKLSARIRKLSELVPDRRLRGLEARGGKRDFARWFKFLPPNVSVDVDFKCDRGIFKRDFFRSGDMLDRYLGLPRVV